jgi:hypothetical protein
MINTIFSRILLVFFTIIIGIIAIPIALIQAFFYDGLLFFFDDWEKIVRIKNFKNDWNRCK